MDYLDDFIVAVRILAAFAANLAEMAVALQQQQLEGREPTPEEIVLQQKVTAVKKALAEAS